MTPSRKMKEPKQPQRNPRLRDFLRDLLFDPRLRDFLSSADPRLTDLVMRPRVLVPVFLIVTGGILIYGWSSAFPGTLSRIAVFNFSVISMFVLGVESVASLRGAYRIYKEDQKGRETQFKRPPPSANEPNHGQHKEITDPTLSPPRPTSPPPPDAPGQGVDSPTDPPENFL
jgi:hypothetical protein